MNTRYPHKPHNSFVSHRSVKWCLLVSITILLVFGTVSLGSANPYSGVIHTDTTWSGVVEVNGDVVVQCGAVLTILPGTKVVFTAGSSVYDDSLGINNVCDIVILGAIVAVGGGSPSDSISFDSDSPSPAPADWGKVCVFPVAVDSLCELGYLSVRHGMAAFEINGGRINIENSRFSDNVTLSGSEARRMLGVTGALLIVPFALVALLWVGLATPWHATPPENVMRYLVLLASSIAVASAFVVLKEVLAEAGERFYSTLGFAANILAGAGYVIWTSFQAGFHVLRVADGEVLPAIASMNSVNDILLFAACALTYAATAAFAASLGRVGWLGRGATRAYVIVSVVLLAFLVMRGVSFPNPAASTMRWYMFPGFVAGIPAIPWLMPFFLGVVLLRRAGYGESVTERV